MSAIAGIFHRNGRPIDQSDLVRMMDTLAHRGPDGGHIWCNGPTGLGHQMLFTTPESLQEKLPLVSQSGDLLITSDARIDNRNELISLLRLNDKPSIEVADSQIILAAYERWGEACPEKLLGPFAFVIWDRRSQRLFCARDHIGVRPFYYHLSEDLFCFASEIKAILVLSGVPRRLNELRVADHLAGMVDDKTITFYQQIYRLPPGHKLRIDSSSVSVDSYWALDSKTEISMSSNAEYAEALRDIFTVAVGRCLRSAYPVGSQLSGGLDSSSVTCVARGILATERNEKLHTFSATFDEGAPNDEMPFIKQVLVTNGVEPHFVRGDESGPLTHMATIVHHTDQPFHSPNIFQSWNLYKFVQSLGVRVVLDGIDGDTTISHGWTYLTELAHLGHWRTLAGEADAAIRRDSKLTGRAVFKRHIEPVLESYAQYGHWIRLFQQTGEIPKYFDVPRTQLLYRYGIRPALSSMRQILTTSKYRDSRAIMLDPLLDEGFVQRIGIEDRLRLFSSRRSPTPYTERENHWYGLSTGLITQILEVMDSLAAAVGLDMRHPYMDKSLIEFCLALPGDQKRFNGWDRIVMRRAMSDILPVDIQWRRDKALFSSNTLGGLFRYDRELMDKILLGSELLVSQYVNVDKLRKQYLQLVATQNDVKQTYVNMLLVVMLEVWLRQSGIST